jgi:NAD(P)-dependent dehydrogenase (short-subunit alcohol dehydrogenase family)
LKTLSIQTALVTGGGSGMGRTIALELCRLGMTVFVADRDAAAAEKTVRTTGGMPGRAEAVEVDVSQSDSVAALFGELKQKAERLDLLVHTAAILGQTIFIEDLDDCAWRQMMAVNLDGTFFCCREAVRWMKVRQSGRIILFSSVAALTPTPGALHYSAAKGGVNMLGRTLAQEVAKYNIRVNIIAPGYVRTPMLNGLPEGFADYILKKTPMRRFADTEEIAGLVVFLSSPEADFFTGQIFSPNGGLVI